MPDIDVSDVILDGDVSGDPLAVLRRQEFVDRYGENSVLVSSLSAAGSVSPIGANSLLREDAYDAQQKTIRVITTFPLRGASATGSGAQYKPDLINWPIGSPDFYVVRSLNDYTPFGAGFVEAECEAFAYEPQAPGQSPAAGMLVFSRTRNAVYAGGAAC